MNEMTDTKDIKLIIMGNSNFWKKAIRDKIITDPIANKVITLIYEPVETFCEGECRLYEDTTLVKLWRLNYNEEFVELKINYNNE